MRRIEYSLSVSLDGYMAGPDGDISWHHVDDELHQHMNDRFAASGMFLDGRVTWELMTAYWPTADAEPGASEITKEFARIWRDTPKIVYSRTLAEAGWNTTIRREVDVAEIRALLAEPGGNLVVGGPNLADTFFEHDLVDEVWLYVNPEVVGAGAPAFPAGRALSLRLVESHRFGNGVVLLRYERGTARTQV